MKTILTTVLILFSLTVFSQKNALIKPIEWKGVTLTYWKVTSIHWTLEYGQTWVDVCPYVSKAQSVTGERDFVPELRKQFQFKGYVKKADIIDSLLVSKIVNGVETNYFAGSTPD